MRYYYILFLILISFSITGCISTDAEMSALADYRNQIETLFWQYQNPPVAELQQQVSIDGNAYYYYYYDIQNKANKAKIDAKSAAIGMKSDKAQKAGMAVVAAAQALEDACQSVNKVIKNNQGHFTERETARILMDAAINEKLEIKNTKTEIKMLEDTIPLMRTAFKDN